MKDNYFYLLSSNATKEYLMDILEVLALPFGTVQHFRYQLRWLDSELKKELPLKDSKNKKLKDKNVVVCYLYQKIVNGKWEWDFIYPIRLGKIVSAYKTGDGDTDIAHFYFKVENYVLYNEQNYADIIKNIAERKWGNCYAFLGGAFDAKFIAKEGESKSAFYKICNSINLEHLKAPEGTWYSPVFCFVEGFRDEGGRIITPKFNNFIRKSYFEIFEGAHYAFEFSTFFPDQQKLSSGSVKLITDEKVFSSPPTNVLVISSHYDEESFSIVPKLLERDIFTLIIFKTKFSEKIEKREFLNIKITFPIKIKRKMIYRILEIGGDLGFAFGTGVIAFAKVIENKWPWFDQNWFWFVLIFYILFAISKVICKFWRG